VALTLLIAGAVCGLIGLALFVFSGVRGLLDATVYQAPMHAVIDCRSGTYYVYQETGSQVTAPGFSYTHSGFTTLTPDQVVVVGPDGRTLTTRSTNGAETITIDSRIYANAVGFDVPTAGEYSVTITPDSPTAVIIAPSLGNQLLSGAPWLILTLVGFPLAIVGLILVIQESSRRKRRGVLGPYGWQPT
jgi:hypothetical protein